MESPERATPLSKTHSCLLSDMSGGASPHTGSLNLGVHSFYRVCRTVFSSLPTGFRCSSRRRRRKSRRSENTHRSPQSWVGATESRTLPPLFFSSFFFLLLDDNQRRAFLTTLPHSTELAATVHSSPTSDIGGRQEIKFHSNSLVDTLV